MQYAWSINGYQRVTLPSGGKQGCLRMEEHDAIAGRASERVHAVFERNT